MIRFIDLSTKAKLFYGFSAMWILLAVVIVAAYLGMTKITRSEIMLRDHFFTEALELRQLQANQNYNRGRILEMMMTEDASSLEAMMEDVQELSRQNDALIDSLTKRDSDPETQKLLTDLRNILAEYRPTRTRQIALIQEGKTEEAARLSLGVQEERYRKMRALIKEMGDQSLQELEKRIAGDMRSTKMTKGFFVVVGAVAILIGSLLIAFLNNIIAKPLIRLTEVAEGIAAGDLTVVPRVEKRTDEVGRLMASFSRMTESLRAMAGLAERIAAGDLSVAVTPQSDKDVLGAAFARMAEKLRRSLADISEAVNVLGSSSGEILSATTQVASSTSETAAAIGETTATVEEVRQAAQLSAQKAQNVSDSAKRVAQVSQTGREAVAETAAGMGRIRDQMESIAMTIVRLSEQGQSIGGIIASVTDLADQSNLLAVNAAIEAARAGEHGRGFAVVANEIESLAEQSKQATAQVREILSDLQKATGAAVMATEQGSRAVEVGVTQSALAGEAINVLAETSEEAAQMAMQIAASSQQQVVGMNQIGTAMENINQAGKETVTGMRQSEEAAKNLHELGRKLTRLVDQYKV